MKRLLPTLIGFSLAIAIPTKPSMLNQSDIREPIFPTGVEIAGPNKFINRENLETVTILMQFPDNRADTLRRSPARFDSMLYSAGIYNNQPYRQGSLNDYYLENSYGNYHVQGAIAGNRWFMSTHNYSEYYDGNYMLSTGDDLAHDNVQQVDPVINFHDYDLNNDGHIDAMFMVHAGADGADNGNINSCWSHAITPFNYTTNDGVIIDGVTNVPEFAMVTPAYETTMCCIAVMCHELGHLAGLPDLYDYTRYTWGVGYWGLMGYGAWGAGGNTPWSPSHMEAWSKVRAGFVTPIVITSDTHNLKIVDIETHPVAYKVWRNGLNRDTCFYLENRQQKGFDTPLPGAGLLIWHIDPGRGSYHNIVDLEEDSTYHLDHGNGVRPNPHFYNQLLGDTSDVLPGIWNRTVFDNYTIPNSRATNGTATNVGVRNIRQVGDTIICDITFSQQDIEEKPTLPIAQTRLSVQPNPFAKSINIKLMPPSNKSHTIKIYNIGGDVVYNTLLNGAGNFRWFGTDKSGKALPNGVYFIRIAEENLSGNQKIIIQR